MNYCYCLKQDVPSLDINFHIACCQSNIDSTDGAAVLRAKQPACLWWCRKAIFSRRKSQNATVKWLESQNTYILHRPARKQGFTRPYRTKKTDYQCQADLVEMIPWAKENNDNRYMLTVIDIFTLCLGRTTAEKNARRGNCSI